MRLMKKLSMSMLALAFMASVSLAGEITGTVTGKDGKPAANVPVRLMKAGGGGAKKAEKAPALADAEKPAEKKPGAGAAAPLQKTETDSAGKFTFKDVEDGAYRVAAGGKDLGTGNKQVKVENGKAEPVSITLADPKPKATK